MTRPAIILTPAVLAMLDDAGLSDLYDDRDVELLAAWHEFQHAYFSAPRSAGRIIGAPTLRPVFDAMAGILAQAYTATGWPNARCRWDRSCCA